MNSFFPSQKRVKMEKPFSSRCSKEWNHLLSHVSLEMHFNMTKIPGVQHGYWFVRMNLQNIRCLHEWCVWDRFTNVEAGIHFLRWGRDVEIDSQAERRDIWRNIREKREETENWVKYWTDVLTLIMVCLTLKAMFFISWYETTEWERLEISSRKLEIPWEHFIQRWAR